MAPKERWATETEAKDYTAAATYLSLITDERTRGRLISALRRAPVTHHRANDLLRASQLPLLPADDPEVAKDLRKVKKGATLAIVLLVRGRLGVSAPLTVADGYHRICASYHIDEDADVLCRMVDLQKR